MELTQSILKEILHYDPETGVFTRSGRKIQSKPSANGYLRIGIDYRRHYQHRIAYLYMTGELPTSDIDHINGNKTDNRWENLRVVTRHGNMRNAKRSEANSSGVTGVYWRKDYGKWASSIKVNYAAVHIGLFDTIFEAAAARKSAEVRYGFHQNHGR